MTFLFQRRDQETSECSAKNRLPLMLHFWYKWGYELVHKGSMNSRIVFFVQHSINTTSVNCFELTQIATQEDK